MAEKKKFIDVKAPLMRSDFRVLGNPQSLDGQTIKLDLSRRLRGKGLLVKFRIFNADSGLLAVPCRLELTRSYIKKMMRKRISYVEDSFSASCSDISCVLKPFLITRKRVSRVVRRNLRVTARDFLSSYVKERTFNEVCEELLNGVLQKALLPKLKKVYPLSFCDIRVFETKEIDKIDLSLVQDNADSPDEGDGSSDTLLTGSDEEENDDQQIVPEEEEVEEESEEENDVEVDVEEEVDEVKKDD